MMKFRENEDAVSPVIGVILMVAITVILAAVIAAFVFGMTDNVQTTKTVVATASATIVSDVKTIHITYQGGPDTALVQNVTHAFNGVANTTPVTGSETEDAKVGEGTTLTGTLGSKDHIVVTANFKDGSSQVILDTFV